jgi:hypothetical protein
VAESNQLDLMIEADKRGLLDPSQKALLDEARARGLVQDAPSGSAWANAGKALIGLPEALTSGLTGMAGNAAKLAYMYGTPIPAGAKSAKDVIESRRPTAEKVQEWLTVQPGTEYGRLAQQYLSQMVPVGDAKEWLVNTFGKGAGDALDTLLIGMSMPKAGMAPAAAPYAAARTAARTELLNRDFPLTAAERGATTVGHLSSASDHLFEGTMVGRAETVNTKLTSEALKTADLPPESVLNAVTRARIGNNLGKRFDTFKDVVITDPAGTFDAALAKLEQEARLGKDPTTLANVVHLRKLLDPKGGGPGFIPGDAWATMRTRLGPRVANGDVAASGIIDAIDQAVYENAPPAVQGELAKVRAQYRNFKILSDAAKADPVGMLTPDSLWGAVNDAGLDGTPMYKLAASAKLIYSGRHGTSFAALPYSAPGMAGAVSSTSRSTPGLFATGVSALSGARILNRPGVAPYYMATKASAKAVTKAAAKSAVISTFLNPKSTPDERKKALEDFANAAD